MYGVILEYLFPVSETMNSGFSFDFFCTDIFHLPGMDSTKRPLPAFREILRKAAGNFGVLWILYRKFRKKSNAGATFFEQWDGNGQIRA